MGLWACVAAPADSTIDTTFDPCKPLFLDLADDASSAETTSADVAIAMWNAVFPTHTTLSLSPNAQHLPLIFEEAAAAFHGVYDDEDGVVFVNRRLADDHERAVTIAHELGHAFGLGHVENPASVMREGNLDIEPSQYDRDNLTTLWGDCALSSP